MPTTLAPGELAKEKAIVQYLSEWNFWRDREI